MSVELKGKDKRDYYIYCALFSLLTGRLFYNNLYAFLLIMCLAPFFEEKYGEYLKSKRREELLSDFKDALYMISASVSAGRQLPRALRDASENGRLLKGKASVIFSELGIIYEEYTENNGSIEEMLEVLGKDSGIEEIKMFSRACSICRKNGGDLEAVCLKTSLMLIDKLEFEREAKAILSEKRMDTVLLLILPFAVLLFLNLCSYSYIKVLYEGTMGRLLMTAALVTSAAALLLSLRIMKSEL